MPTKRSKSRKSRAATPALDPVAETDEIARASSGEHVGEEASESRVGSSTAPAPENSQPKTPKLKPLKEKSAGDASAGSKSKSKRGSKGGKLSPLSSKKKRGDKKLQSSARVIGIAEGVVQTDVSSFDNILKALSQKQGDWLPALSETQVVELASKVEVVKFNKNDIIYDPSQEGEEAMHFFFLLDGYVKGTIQSGNSTQKLFTTRTFGATFGDKSLIGGCPRPHILLAKTRVVAGKIQKEHYVNLFRGDVLALEKVRTIAMSTATKAGRMRKGLLLEVMSQAELLTIADEASLLWFRERETIIQQGDSLETVGNVAKQMYMLESGTANVIVRVQDPITDEISEKVIENLDQSGTLFGETALMFGTKRSATIRAETDCRVCAMPHFSLDKILDARPDVRKKFVDMITNRKHGFSNKTAGYLIVDPERTESVKASGDESFELGRTSSAPHEVREERMRAAMEIKTKGDEHMKHVMFLFDSVARSGDWNRYHPEIQKALKAAEEQFEILENEYSTELPVDGLDMKKLMEKIQRLEYLRARANAWMPILPEMEEEEFRAYSLKRLTNTSAQYGATPHKLRAHGFTIDWRSMREVCQFLEQMPDLVTHSIEGIPRFEGFLEVKYGQKMAKRLFRDVLVWYERKSAAWDVLSELHHQRQLKKTELPALIEKKKDQDWNEQDQVHQVHLERGIEEIEAMETKINEDLATMNEAVLHSAFAFVSPPPGRALIDSPLLAYALHLQRIMELKEDLRFGRAMATQHAQLAMTTLIRESTLHSVNTKHKRATMDEYIHRNQDGSRRVAPIVADFMGELGSWLFTTDTTRWDRQARIASQMGALPHINN